MKTFKGGDRVKLFWTDPQDTEQGLKAGEKGTVLGGWSSPAPMVDWDCGIQWSVTCSQLVRKPRKIKVVKKLTPTNKASLKCFCDWKYYRKKYVRRWNEDCRVHKQ